MLKVTVPLALPIPWSLRSRFSFDNILAYTAVQLHFKLLILESKLFNPSSALGHNVAPRFKLRIRGAGACDPCVGSANRAGYAMSVYPTLSPPISFAARYGPHP